MVKKNTNIINITLTNLYHYHYYDDIISLKILGQWMWIMGIGIRGGGQGPREQLDTA